MSEALQLDPLARNRLERTVDDLKEEFRGIWGSETIDRYVSESIEQLQGARLKDFIHVFVWRFTRERLRALAQAEGKVEKEVPEVLFVCVHNAGRSQMAAGLLSKLAAGRVNVRSCGSEPSDRINPAAVEAMSEVGVDMSQEFPKPLTNEVVGAADVVITMGCGDACPIFPGKRYEDWELEDPAGQDLETVRGIRDQIQQRVERLIGELVDG